MVLTVTLLMTMVTTVMVPVMLTSSWCFWR